MICPACEGKNRDEARFCTFCGTTLALRCAICDTEIVPGGRFCDSCGAPVGDEPVAAEPVAAARKVVTVLFADLTGSTALEENMDAESVRSVLDRFYAAMRIEVERHGGRLVKFTGDGVMAAFGVPEVSEDDAARAIQAALAMRAECEQLDSVLQLGLALKIGVNTGEVVVSASDEDVVGDAVNVAARLEGAASSGEILVGAETWRVTRGTSSYETVTPLVLKGKSEPVPAYRLVALEDISVDAGAPFVGRDRELNSLIAIFEDAVAANAARLVTIVGSPGLGKTRLARELMSALQDRARVRETRCDPAGAAAFAPIAEALRSAASIPDDATEADVIAALEALIPEGDEDRERIASRAAAVLGAGQPGSTEETFWAIRRLIEMAAQVAPVVLVLDDLHWAEPMLLDLIEHLAEWIHDAPVLLVGTGRPEIREIRPSLCEGGRAAAVIALEGLDGNATQRLATELLGAAVPDELLARIPASTEGNPLFVRELVRMLVDDGVLRRDGDGWTVTVDVDAIQVPPTIQSLLAARVDRLASDERTVVELASVIGKEFYRGALRELLPPSVREQLDACLESLRRKELVEPAGTYWIDEPVYRFHHVLIRDAAYRRLLKESRAEVHERVAEWLERKTAGVLGEHEELIGYHLEQAHDYERQLGRTDDELGRRASGLLGLAARRALDRDDLSAAAGLSGRALDRLRADDADRAELLLVRCEALLSMGDVGTGAPAVAELERLAMTPRLSAWATCFAGQLANLTSPERLQDTEQRVAEAAAVLVELGDEVGAAKAHNVHASTLAGLGRFAECEAALDDALTAARAARDNRRITATLGSAPPAQLWGPNPVSRAGGRCLDIVRLLRITTGSPAVEATSMRCQAVLEAFRGRADAARGMLRRARRTFTELGLRHELLETEQFEGIVELVAGDAAAAEAHLRRAHDGFRRVGVDVLAAQSAALLARAHLMLGEDLEAEAFVGTSEQLGSQDLKTAIAWRSVRAEILAHRGELDEAKRLAEAAVALAERTDALIDHGNACRSLAFVLRAGGDAAGARRADERAFALFERKGATALIDAPPADTTATPAAPAATLTTPPNAAVANVNGVAHAFGEREWTTVGRLVVENFTYEDRRRALAQEPVVGPHAWVESWKSVAGVGVTEFSTSVLSTRGGQLALFVATFTGRSFATDTLLANEVDDDGLAVRAVVFDRDDFDTAITYLDERYIAGEGAVGRDVVRALTISMRAINERDWQTLEGALADDLVVIDHRPASLGELRGPQRWVESIRQINELVADLRTEVVAYEALTANRGVIRLGVVGTSVDGGTVELPAIVVIEVDGGLTTRATYFPVDALDAALALFEGADGKWVLENEATRVSMRASDAVLARDWTTLERLLAEDCVAEDRRELFRGEGRGRAARIEVEKGIVAIGVREASHVPLALRGERLALFRVVAGGDTGFAVEFLRLDEVNGRGEIARTIVFEPDDLDAAMDGLDERFVGGEGAASSEVLHAVSRICRAYNTRDWSAYRDTIADDVIVTDHRLVSLGEIRGLDPWIESSRQITELVPTNRIDVTSYEALERDRCVARMLTQGTSVDGALVELEFLAAIQTRDGRITRFTYFPIEELDAALARFDALAPAPTRELSNEAITVARRIYECMVKRDWDGLDLLHHDDCVIEDRRHVVGDRHEGVAEAVDYMRSIASIGAARFSLIPLATRGDDLALARVYFRGSADDSFEVEILIVVQSDGHGRRLHSAAFEAGALDAAFAELDEWFVAGEGAPYAEDLRVGLSLNRAASAGDVDQFRRALADDIVLVDHRPASLGEVRGADKVVEAQSALIDLMSEVRADITCIHAQAPGLVLATQHVRGSTIEGAPIERVSLRLLQFRAGLTSRLETFAIDDLDAAFARFDQLTATHGQPKNRATRVREAAMHAFLSRDWDALAALHADDVIWIDHRLGSKSEVLGRDAIVDLSGATADVGVTRIDLSVIATRGERLALSREIFGADTGSFETELLSLNELNDAGLFIRRDAYAPGDLDAAFDELDERFIAGEGAPSAELLRLGVRGMAALNAHDWEGFGAVVSPDVVFVDRRPASFGELRGRERHVGLTRELAELVPDVEHRGIDYRMAGPHAGLGMFEIRGTNADGGSVEMAYLQVMTLCDGLIDRIERFALDQREEALARLEELSAGDTQRLTNACTRVMALFAERFTRADWDGVGALYSERTVQDDRRRFVGGGRSRGGRARTVAHLQEARRAGATSAAFSTVGIRGERLSLSRGLFESPSGYEVQILAVTELANDGLVSRMATLDPDNLDEAFALLDEWFIDGEGAAFADLVGLAAEICPALNAGDWERYGAVMSPDVVFVDRRPVAYGEVRGRDAVIEIAKRMSDLVANVRHEIVSIPAIARDRMVMEYRLRGTNEDGGDVELAFFMVGLARDGVGVRFERFDVGQREQALARFEELGAAEPQESLAVRTMREHDACVVRGDWERLRSLHAADVSWTDTRRGLGSTVYGVDDRLADLRTFPGVGVARIEQDIVATRGELLVLSRVTFSAKESDSFETEALRLCEVDEQGRITAGFRFDTADEDAAFAMLDERFLHGEGAACAEAVRRNMETVAIVNERDWAAYAAGTTDDFVLVDHRPASLGELRIEGLIDAHQKLIELIPDLKVRVRNYQELDEDRWLSEIAALGRTRDDDPLDLSFLNVGQLRDGKVARTEFFPSDRLEDALARFDELSRTDGTAPTVNATIAVGALENRAARVVQQMLSTFDRRDWDALAVLVTEDSIAEDRRRGLQSIVSGREARVENARAVAGVGGARASRTLLATCGDRLCLHRFLVRSESGDGFETEFLRVDECSEAGQLVATITFDADDLDAAQAELDGRYVAQEGRGCASWLELGRRGMSALNARDWEGLEAIFHPDLVLVDHRPALFGEVRGRDRFVAMVRELAEIAPDTKHRFVSITTAGGVAALSTVVISGTNSDGGAVEMVYLQLNTAHDGVIDRIERFDLDHLDEAIVRFEEFSGEEQPIGPLANACTRAVAFRNDHYMRGDWDAVAASYSDATVIEDRRRGLGGRLVGRELMVAQMQEGMRTGATRCELTTVAIRGERLALSRLLFAEPPGVVGFEVELLSVNELDDEGQICAGVTFDPDERDAAFDELNQRYISGEGAPYADVLRVQGAVQAAINRHDWETLPDLVADDLVRVDQRRVSIGDTDVEGWIGAIRALTEVIPDLAIETLEFRGLTRDTWWAQVYNRGAAQHGGLVDLSCQSVAQVRDGRIVRWEIFDDSRADEARAAFERLNSEVSDDDWAPENAASRVSADQIRFVFDGNLDAFIDGCVDDVRFEDRRVGLRWEGVGREEVRERAQAFSSLANARYRELRLATYGDKLCLTRQTIGDANSWESERLVLWEIDDDRKLLFVAILDPDDLDAAFAELEERFVRGEGAPYAEVLEQGARQREALKTGDWGAYRRLMADDVVLIDHRPVSLGEVHGRDAVVEAVQAFGPLMRGLRPRVVTYLALETDRALIEIAATGEAAHGGTVEQGHLRIQQLRDGRVVRIELFPVEARDVALTRFADLGPRTTDHTRALPDTMALRITLQRNDELLRTEDWDAYAKTFAEDVVYEDRRRGLRHRDEGREAFIEHMRLAAPGTAIRSTPLATRGERLVLIRHAASMRDGFEVELLGLHEYDEQGLSTATVLFDHDDLDGAFAELDHRYLMGTEPADAERIGLAAIAAINARDWTTYRRCFADDFVLVNHHPASFGTIVGADANMESNRALVDLVADIRLHARATLRSENGVFLSSMWVHGTNADGGEIEFDDLYLIRFDDGRFVRGEVFPIEQLDAALERFDDLAES